MEYNLFKIHKKVIPMTLQFEFTATLKRETDYKQLIVVGVDIEKCIANLKEEIDNYWKEQRI